MRRIILALFISTSALMNAQSGDGPLAAPTGLEASDGAYSTKVGLSWDHVRDGAMYQVFRGRSNDPAAAVSVGATSSIIFYDTTAEPELEYRYWVRAENGARRSLLSRSDSGFRAPGKTSGFGAIAPLAPPPNPPENPVTGAKVYLGKTLFWDEQLSSTRSISCGTCHRPRTGGSDPRTIIGDQTALNPGVDGAFGTTDDVVGSPGVPLNRSDGTYPGTTAFKTRPQVTRRKAQPVLDAAYADIGAFWDGRAAAEFRDPLTGNVIMARGGSLESQALHPFLNPVEMSHMGAVWADITRRISNSQPLALSPMVPAPLAAWLGSRTYAELFAEAFGTPEITPVRIAMVIASYERTLYSDRVPQDMIASGIIEEPVNEGRGRTLFFRSSCDLCHRGSVMSDNRFRFIGVRPDDEDQGRFEVTNDPRDKGRFRTPSLRNLSLRGPFMHNGSQATIEDVIDFYDRGGDFDGPNKDSNFVRKLRLTVQEKSDFVAFLRNQMTDSRVAAGAGPLFDRPMLFSESARLPTIVAPGSAPTNGTIPQVVIVEPPVIGNTNFTIGLYDARGDTNATLVIDAKDPGPGPAIPSKGSFFHGTRTTTGEGATDGASSLAIRIPDDPALVGTSVIGRWYVRGVTGPSVSPAFRITFFAPRSGISAGPVITTLSAASFALGFVAPGSIVSGFGPGLASSILAADSLPLPTVLGGVSVTIIDSAGVEHAAPLFFVSPGQINYLVPTGAAVGEAIVSVKNGANIVATGRLQVTAVAPAIFSANSNGMGPAAAIAVRVAPGGAQTFPPVIQFNVALRRFDSVLLDFGAPGNEVFLTLFGTGIRLGDASTVTATIAGESVEVLFAGAQPQFVGTDQVNLRIPRSLIGRGEVDVVVTINGRQTNAVRIRL